MHFSGPRLEYRSYIIFCMDNTASLRAWAHVAAEVSIICKNSDVSAHMFAEEMADYG